MFSSFGGGIHPPEYKRSTKDLKFLNLAIPHICYISLQQHIGAPASPVVKKGDVVSEGQLIGSAQGFISAPVHSSVPGKVMDIADIPTIYGSRQAVIVEAEGAFTASARQPQPIDWESLAADEIREKIRDGGIVGLGGAAFPTAVKLSPPPEKAIDTLVVNGAECEPYLTADDMLMKTYPEAVIEGIRMTMKALGVARGVIGVEDNKWDAYKSLARTLSAVNPLEEISVRKLKTKYPQGAEKLLIKSLLGREVPSGGLPMDAGVVVQNVGTIYAIREAVALGRPLFMRHITVSGKAIARPGNYKVRIGMRIADIVDECGGFRQPPAKIVMGGPMCGISVHTMDVPVVKGSSGVLFLTEEEVSFRDYSPCIRCGKCVAVCPVGLHPCDMGNAVEKNRLDIAAGLSPFDCIMCGSCSFVCPANRPLSHFFKSAQEKMRVVNE
jgi:electron transport complex protein RnfC